MRLQSIRLDRNIIISFFKICLNTLIAFCEILLTGNKHQTKMEKSFSECNFIYDTLLFVLRSAYYYQRRNLYIRWYMSQPEGSNVLSFSHCPDMVDFEGRCTMFLRYSNFPHLQKLSSSSLLLCTHLCILVDNLKQE